MSGPRKQLAPGDRAVPWADAIRSEWSLKPMSVVAAVNQRALSDATRPDTVIRYIDIGSVDDRGRIGEFAEYTFEEAPSRARRVPVRGDTIISTVRTYLKAVAFIAADEPDLVCSTGFAVLSPRPFMDPKFLFYWVQSDVFVDEVCARSVGVSYPALNPSEIGHLPVAVPSRPEQSRIAAFLDRRLAETDRLIESKERMIEVLAQHREALIAHAIGGGLASGPTKSAGRWWGRLPEHWTVTKLMHLTPPTRPIMYGIVLPGPDVPDGVPIVKSGDCTSDRLLVENLNRTTRDIEAGYVRSRLAANDVVYAIRGSVGMAALVPPAVAGANLTQDAARIAPREGVNARWLLYLVQSHQVWSQLEAGVVGATVKGVNIRDLKRPVVPLPAPDEQDQIARYLDARTAKLDAMVRATAASVDKLREYRHALITSAVTGKLGVPMEKEAA